jgi:hypothetical protein
MSTELLLSTIEAQKKMQAVMWTTSAVCAIWGIGILLAIGSSRSELAAARAALQSKRTAANTQEITLHAVSREVTGMPADAVVAFFPGTAPFADRISHLAVTAGAQMSSIEFGGDAAATAAQSGGSQPSGNAVQCVLVGSFASLMRTLNAITYSNLDLQVTQIQIERQQIDSRTGMAPVEMRITGQVKS